MMTDQGKRYHLFRRSSQTYGMCSNCTRTVRSRALVVWDTLSGSYLCENCALSQGVHPTHEVRDGRTVVRSQAETLPT